jgi:hypothetical protein
MQDTRRLTYAGTHCCCAALQVDEQPASEALLVGASILVRLLADSIDGRDTLSGCIALQERQQEQQKERSG